MRYIGAHVSTSGGWDKACEKAAGMGCNAMQIFSSSPRMWKMKSVDEIDVDGFVAAMKKSGIEKSFIHATYLINLASDNPELVKKSREVLINDLRICGRAGMDGVVVHIGSHQGRGFEAVKDQLVEEIERIIKAAGEGTLLLENSAGQKGKVGKLEEIAYLLGKLNASAYAKAPAGKVGWCVDTCHAHADGYLLGQDQKSKIKSQSYNSKLKNNQRDLFGDAGSEPAVLAEEIGRLELWERLGCVHVNDSRDAFGSARDRHENLGEGMVGKEELREFLNDEKLDGVAMVLEVPGVDGKGPDRENVERLKGLVNGEVKKKE